MNITKELSDSLLAACKAAGIEKPKYIAQDLSGAVWYYEDKPDTNNHGSIWATFTGENRKLDHQPYADDWQESLLEWVDQIADTSKNVDDACKIAYRKHIDNGNGTCWSRADCYRAAWQDALAWKGGNND